MGFFVFHAKVQSLIYEKSDIEWNMAQLTKRIKDVQNYADMLGKRKIQPSDLFSMPASMLGRTINYLNYAHNSSLAYMNQNAPYFQQMMQQAGQTDPRMIEFMKKKLYEQGRDRALEIATKYLKQEEEALVAEKDKLSLRLEEVKKDMQESQTARKEGLDALMPKYTGLS